MKPHPLIVLCLYSLFTCVLSVNPVNVTTSPHTNDCVAYMSRYHKEQACQCVVFESAGGSQGNFFSPNYNPAEHYFYPSNINCILYTFIGEEEEIVELTFNEFDLQMPTLANFRCTDFLRFFLDLERAEVNQRTKSNYQLCGNFSMIQRTYYSSQRSLILEFHTDSIQSNNTGFIGSFKFIDKRQFESIGVTKRWSGCVYDVFRRLNTTGRFFSEKFPQNYPPDSNCQYIFYGNTDERVKIIFRSIALEPTKTICTDSSDYIRVHDGQDASSPVIAHYCNQLNDIEVISSGDHLFIQFQSDSRIQNQGFAATFEFIKAATSDSPGHLTPTPTQGGRSTSHPLSTCNRTFMSAGGKEGIISYPDDGKRSSSGGSCTYRFQGQTGERVQVIFREFELSYPNSNPENAKGESCESEGLDTVKVGLPPLVSADDVLGTYCGSNPPTQLMSSKTNLTVIFSSHSSGESRFQFQYRFVTNFGVEHGHQEYNEVCEFEYANNVSTTGTFTSPNYPGKYPRDTLCHYIFTGDPGTQVYIDFQYFDVEGAFDKCDAQTESDYVEFSNFDIGLVDRKMRNLCGSKQNIKSKVHSDGAFFRVTFRSNSKYDATGFEAFYQFRKIEGPVGTADGITQSEATSQLASILCTTLCLLSSVRLL